MTSIFLIHSTVYRYHVLKGFCHDTHHVHHVGLRLASFIVHLRCYLVDHGQEVGMNVKQWYRTAWRCYSHSAVNYVTLNLLQQMQQDSAGRRIGYVTDD